MNARAAKLVRRVRAKLDPQAHEPALEARLKRMWQRTPRTERHGLRTHLKRVLAAAPEDVKKVFQP